MAMKQSGQKTYKTMQGRTIDMEMLRKKNELTPAVGNAKVNARGDELGPGGKIVRKREDIVNEYYQNTQGVPDEPTAQKTESVTTEKESEPKVETKQEQKKTTAKPKSTKAQTKEPVGETPSAEEAAEWEEDEEGNFTKKGE